MAKAKGFKFTTDYIDKRAIVIDEAGVPWLVDPESGTIYLVKVIMPDDKQSAVVKKKRK